MAALEVVKSMKESLSRRRIIDTKHEAEFTFAAPKAKKVCIAGNFNDWNSTSMPMKKSADGTWKNRPCKAFCVNDWSVQSTGIRPSNKIAN
jgi:1,4-alpha-glucan branching enzyme